MTDKRELILARLVTILNGVSGIASVFRNAPIIDPDSRPAIVVYDGDETATPHDPNRGGPPALRRVTMIPDIVLLLSDVSADIGTAMNSLRVNVMHAILTDATLLALTVNGISVAYGGAQHVVQDGRRVEGALALQFEISYTLRTTDLAA